MVIVAEFHISESIRADINMYYCDLSYQRRSFDIVGN